MSAHNVFPLEELNLRLSNVRTEMNKANIDGIVITIPENIYYLNLHLRLFLFLQLSHL